MKGGPDPAAASSSERAPRSAQEATGPTPNAFFTRGELTFVVGTAGDELADRGVVAQAEFIRALLFSTSKLVTDASIDVGKGPRVWPKNPVVYGGPQVNTMLAELAPTLPFELSSDALTIGGETFSGPGYRVIAVVPGRAPDERGPGYPEFLLYAGTGTPGVAEINEVSHGAEPILIADQFGRLVTGRWVRGPGAELEAALASERAPRPAWRGLTRTLEKGGARLRVHFLAEGPADADEQQLVEACVRGVKTVIDKLGVSDPVQLSIYVYPDAETKRRLTGDGGHGNAVVSSGSVHVIRLDPAVGGELESLLAHEATHVLAYEAWGPPGSALFGEGLAVWVSGQYGGRRLGAWKSQITEHAPIATLLGPAFTKLPEQTSYPIAGLIVKTAVAELGRDAVRDHLLGASAESWAAACEQAGTTPDELEQALSNALAN
ncbi:hypothetical protein ENSA5_46780 [Enhygromyxa salina]|uniref:Peptidase MA-like domain-containing protein n=1 Tax=Enhygromyxa salina TaxID=215803 RepID=A0A2S9XIZ0_9BACT|nr:DUF2268 domain-containing putative Zn-dependent protease [Enhygromyxa salina]PRP92846.1 hypothetical protein ENSA5_46780 [Enhygromyxa salina]